MAVIKLGIHLIVLALATLAGCTQIVRPSVAIRQDELAAIERRPEVIRLLITEEYRSFVSNDRGHALADSQRYEIGPALAAMTPRYFRASFCEVVVGEARIPGGHVDFVVTPMVEHFDNSVNMSSLSQRLEIQLEASIALPGTPEIRRVIGDPASEEYGFEHRKSEQTGRGELLWGGSVMTPAPGDKVTEKLLGRAIQGAVRELVERVASEIDALRPANADRSCPSH